MSFFAELRLAVRRWASRPALALTAIITLSLGIASMTAIFSVVYAVVLKPLPWRNSEDLVSIYVQRPHWRESAVLANAWNTGNLSWPIYQGLLTKSKTLIEVATWNRTRPTLNGERNELVTGMQVSAGFLPMLGVTPFMGRFFTDADDAPGGDACVISYEAWQRRYGASQSVLGRRVSLDESPYTIVGVLPPGFDFTGIVAPEFLISWGNVTANNRNPGNHFMYGLARVRPGVPLADAIADADPLVRGTEKADEKQARLVPLEEDQRGRSRAPLVMLLGASALLLLIACANVAGLLLGEGGARRYEMAVRIALGSSRAIVARQLLIESLVLAAVSIAAALAIVFWITPMIASLAPQLPRATDIVISMPVLAFGIAAGLLTVLLFGIVPAFSFAGVESGEWIRGSGRTATTRSRAHGTLVICEVALAVLLVAGASLFGETLVRMTSQAIGFRSDHLVVASLRLPRDQSVTPEMRRLRTDELAARLASLPGVESGTVTSTAPFSGSYGSNGITIDGKNAESARHVVSDTYFATLGIPIVKGRAFDASDQPGAFAAVVTQDFERQYLDGEAIGRRFTLNRNVHQVIGVVPATKHRRFSDEAGPAMYILNRQVPTWATPQFIVRANADGRSLIATIRKTIESTEPQASIVSIEMMSDMMRRTVAEERFRAQLSIVFGVAALLLAAIGLYGLITRLVSDRRREIGVRLAIGAPRGAVVRMVMRHAMTLVVAGLVIGVPAALAAAGFVRSMLYGVSPTAPHTFLAVIALLTLSAAVAACLPAVRAANTDPASVLRIE